MTDHSFHRTLTGRGFFRIRPELESIRRVMRALDHPERRVPAVHIAGTNGKGSVAAGIASVLEKSGYHVGLYTSPHLSRIHERIQIQRQPISDDWLVELGREILSAEDACGESLTYFELTTAIAYLAFARARCDINVIECGMGGLWDATNILEHPLLVVLTSVGMDHARWLGATETRIAAQKCGILKPGRPVVSGVRGPAREVVARAARQRGCPIRELDRDFRVQRRSTQWTEGRQLLRYEDPTHPCEDYVFSLLGSHQADNAALVIAATHALESQGWRVSDHDLRRGLRDVRWPGRLELVEKSGIYICLDGAHNPPAMARLIESLKESPFRDRRTHVLFSAYQDKDIATMATQVADLADTLYLAALPGPRAASVSTLRNAFRDFAGPLQIRENLPDAWSAIFHAAQPGDLIVVTGSLALVGLLRSAVMQTLSDTRSPHTGR